MSEEVESIPSEAEDEVAPQNVSRLRRFGYWLGGVATIWLVLALGVLYWQPGRFVQLGIGLAAVVAAVWLPRKRLEKLEWLAAAAVCMAAIFYLPSFALSQEVEFMIRSVSLEADTTVYLVHTDYGAKAIDDPGETFRNQDSPLFWKVNSWDWDGVLNSLQGHRVRARVIGIRFADRSVYRNIISVEAIDR
jgi:hypothetical protein